MKDLIVGTVDGLEYEKLAPFVESLRATGSKAEVCLFVANVTSETIARLKAMGVTIVPFSILTIRRRQPYLLLWPLWKHLLASRDFKGKCALAKKVFSLGSMRWVMAYDWIESRQHLYSNILLTDVRDVIFQRDPFTPPLAMGLQCFLEPDTSIIGKCIYNTQMARSAMGEEAFQRISANIVSCAGTVLGDTASIIAYLVTMIETLCIAKNIEDPNDQGIHNYLIYSGKLPNVTLVPNENGSVYTVGAVPVNEILLNEANEIVRPDGSVVPIVHQYDRHPKLVTALTEQRKSRIAETPGE